MRTLDEVDIKILNQLKKNARMPLKELSAEVYLIHAGGFCQN